ncbi:hypothetical protein DFH08DRAFT_252697 [Mycena albidolilacea]|uniref:Phospholipase/carboxylesterase/thioesterase domain-containing protein n=1 Tax=Mycena albidolilacea TaxID=1033008 RepID=A0AAD7ELJ8_9AGAR|nr:hypothetical protein DFH08DRAFT_252697 [Mycena albidolilacea]
MSQDIHLRENAVENSSPRVKKPPQTAKIPVPFFYAPSDDGTDENLLILLHGLGDTHIPFSKLGRQLKLPQTAVLAVRAPDQVPFLYEDSFAWFPSFDDLGELIERPNPTPALLLLDRVFRHLTDDCAWPINRIHLFGFAQGGSVAAEFGIKMARETLGSIVTVSGPLLSYPTVSTLSLTPLLVAYRPSAVPSSALTAFKKGFHRVVEHKMGADGGMPASKPEWEPIMRFWSEVLARRRVEGVYEVMSGIAST